MKTNAAITPNGNLIYQKDGLTLIYIAEKEITTEFTNYHRISSFDKLVTILPTKEIETEKIISDLEIIEKQAKIITSLKEEIENLRKIKEFYGECPEWHLKGFKSKESFEKFILKEKKKEFYKNAKKNSKLKTNKDVDEKLCWIFTTEYQGKNGGFRHFSRYINKSLNKISLISDFSKHKNLCVKKINGDVIEVRGSIEINECQI
ncbi:MAG: hypothetical protein WC390_07415 [Sulfurimonas sp.]|jgi:hypothetical protein